MQEVVQEPTQTAAQEPVTSENIKDGIHIGLPEEIYHDIPALSVSGIKTLNISPLHYWWNSKMNPKYVKKERTPAMAWGAMRHKYLLENSEFFNEYALQPDKSDFKRVLSTLDDLKEYMKENDIKPSSGSKANLIERIREAGLQEGTVVWDDVVENFETGKGKKSTVLKEEIDELKLAKQMLDLQLGKHGLTGVIEGGIAELSIIWTRNGTRMKSRFDFVKPGSIVDYKTFSNEYAFPIDKAAARAIQASRYHLQALMYLNAWEEARKMVNFPTNVHGATDEQKVLVGYIFSGSTLPTFSFLFQTSDAPYEVRVKHFHRQDLVKQTENAYWIKARQDLSNALATYQKYKEKYGDNMWLAIDSIQSDITDLELPWIMNELNLQNVS